jgi:putative ABC transport system ATP-binding protein
VSNDPNDNPALNAPAIHQPILRVENLHKRYTTGGAAVDALRGVCFTAGRGEFIAIMGASGSGKSTLLHLIGGLDLPTHGSVFIEDQDITHLSDRQRTLFRRRRIGVIFQAYNLLPTLSARENVALPFLLDGRSAAETDDAVEALIETVHLADRADHRPQAMSGGEQQRVAVARSLLNDPALLLADEPTGNLDSQHAQEIWALLRELSSVKDRTVLMVTHEAAAAAYADRVLVLKDGQLVGEICPQGVGDATLVATEYQKLAG